MIYVVATIELKSGVRDAFLEIFRANVPAVLAEEGCISYAPTVDVVSGIPAQGAPRENVVTVVEQWENLDRLRAHLQSPHMAAYREKVKDMVVRVTLSVTGSV